MIKFAINQIKYLMGLAILAMVAFWAAGAPVSPKKMASAAKDTTISVANRAIAVVDKFTKPDPLISEEIKTHIAKKLIDFLPYTAVAIAVYILREKIPIPTFKYKT